MIGRPYSRSTTTAWAFCETSTMPLKNPTTARASTSWRPVVAMAGPGIVSASATAAVVTTGRLPKRSIAGPASCMPTHASAPSTRSMSPSSAWSTPVRSLMVGMFTTHMPSTKPLRAKMPKVAIRALEGGTARA
jgi:hypothetical protein